MLQFMYLNEDLTNAPVERREGEKKGKIKNKSYLHTNIYAGMNMEKG